MKLRWFAGQGDLPPVATVLSFDFMVAERPKYIPGSGPVLAPITAMPPHDKDGFIMNKIQFKRQLRYMVGYEQYPQLKVSVQPQNILDWVSRHALEEWEAEQYAAEEKRREEQELPAILAKEERRRKRMEAMSRAALGIDRRKLKRKRTAEDYSPGKNGRPAKVGRLSRLPRNAHRRGPSARHQEDMVFTSPRLSQRSQPSQQPSLSTPSRKFTSTDMMDIESNDEGSIDTDTAIDLQLGLDLAGQSRSTSESVDMPRIRTTSPPSTDAADSSGGERRWRIFPERSAVAGTSSREALKIYEDLERKKKSTVKPLVLDPQSPLNQEPSSLLSSYTYKSPNTSLSKPAHSPSPRSSKASRNSQPKQGEGDLDSDGEELEYELHAILDEEMRMENGQKVLYYLIDWVGNYDNTWEPATNVGQEAIEDFKERCRRKRISMRITGSADSDMELGYTPRRRRNGTDHNGKGKMREDTRGQLINDDGASEDRER